MNLPKKPTPAGAMDNPVAAAGDVSLLDVHSVLASPAPTISPSSTADIGGLARTSGAMTSPEQGSGGQRAHGRLLPGRPPLPPNFTREMT